MPCLYTYKIRGYLCDAMIVLSVEAVMLMFFHTTLLLRNYKYLMKSRRFIYLSIRKLFNFFLPRWVRFQISKDTLKKHYLSYNGYNRNVMAVFAWDYIGFEIFLHGYYEIEELDAVRLYLEKNLSQCRLALDVGANIGNHTIHFAHYFDEVLAFEPNIKTYELLKFNTSDYKNVTALNVGLSDSDNQLKAYAHRWNMGSASLESGPGRDLEYTFNVIRLDDSPIVKGRKIDFIKIDVEGHELEVLKGMSEILNQQSPVIAFEFLPDDYGTASQVVDFLKANKYTHFLNASSNCEEVTDWNKNYNMILACKTQE